MTDGGIVARTGGGLRSIIPSFLPGRKGRPRHHPGRALAASIRNDPPFPLGASTILADMDVDDPDALLTAIAEAIAIVEASPDPWSDPGEFDMNGFDWVEMTFPLTSGRPLTIGMPTVLDGGWIAHDRVLMLRVAAACLVDLDDNPGNPTTIDPVVEWMTRAQSLAQKLARHLPEDAGAHFAMPSQFGPADLRSHAINGAPVSAYELPEDDFLRSAPRAYEMYGGDRRDRISLEIKRARSLSSPHYGDAPDHEWIGRTVAGFVPRRRPEPAPTTHRTFLALDGEGLMILMRDPSTGMLTLPSYDRDGWDHAPDPAGIAMVSAVLGSTIASPRKTSTIRRVSRIEGQGELVLDVVRGSCRGWPRPEHDDGIVRIGPFSDRAEIEPMIGALVMPDVRAAFRKDEAEQTGPDPYEDRRVVVDPAVLARRPTNAEVARTLVRILRIRGRLDRAYWNAYRQTGTVLMPRTASGALGFISVVGGAFEDLPEVLENALAGPPEDAHTTSFESRLADTYRMFSGIRIPRDWHPGAFSGGASLHSSAHIRDIWRDLCDAVAEPIGMKGRYGVLIEPDAFG